MLYEVRCLFAEPEFGIKSVYQFVEIDDANGISVRIRVVFVLSFVILDDIRDFGEDCFFHLGCRFFICLCYEDPFKVSHGGINISYRGTI